MIEESISGNSNCRSTTLSYPPKPDFSLSLGGRNSCRSTLFGWSTTRSGTAIHGTRTSSSILEMIVLSRLPSRTKNVTTTMLGPDCAELMDALQGIAFPGAIAIGVTNSLLPVVTTLVQPHDVVTLRTSMFRFETFFSIMSTLVVSPANGPSTSLISSGCTIASGLSSCPGRKSQKLNRADATNNAITHHLPSIRDSTTAEPSLLQISGVQNIWHAKSTQFWF